MTSLFCSTQIKLTHKCRLEYVVSQLQEQQEAILVVQDGYKVLIFNNTEDLPENLRFDFLKYNDDLRTSEFHYRDESTDESWVFFSLALHEWLKRGRREPFAMESLISSRSKMPSLSFKKRTVSASSSMPVGIEMLGRDEEEGSDEDYTDESDEDLCGLAIDVLHTGPGARTSSFVSSRIKKQ